MSRQLSKMKKFIKNGLQEMIDEVTKIEKKLADQEKITKIEKNLADQEKITDDVKSDIVESSI